MPSLDDRLVTIDEAAAYLGCTRRTLYTWRSRGRGPRGIRLHHGGVRYRVSDLLSWVEAQAAESPSTTGRDGSV